MNVYISFDGDHIGRQVGLMALRDDEEGLRRISQSIELGNELWEKWVYSKGGTVVSTGGDEGRVKVGAEYLEEVPQIRKRYEGLVGSTVSVGVGMTLAESNRALIAAKLRGGNQLVMYSPELEEEIEQAQKPQTESDKIYEQYLGKNQSARPFRAAAFKHKSTGKVYETGAYHNIDPWLLGGEANEAEQDGPWNSSNWEAGFVTHDGIFMNREQAAQHVDSQRFSPITGKPRGLDSGDPESGLRKAQRPMSPAKPRAEASEHSQGEAMANFYNKENPPSPEMTHAAAGLKDIESEFHSLAEQEQQVRQHPTDEDTEQLKARIASILQKVKEQAPIMEQIKQSSPDTYAVLMAMVQSVIDMARKVTSKEQKQPQAPQQEQAQPEQAEQKLEAHIHQPHEQLPPFSTEDFHPHDGEIWVEHHNPDMSKAEDKLHGGVADGASPYEFDKEQLKIGIKHEMEHTDDVNVAAEIAMDHLAEDPSYYSKLKGSGLADELKKSKNPTHTFVGKCTDIGKRNCLLTKAGSASDWDRMTTEESYPISKEKFEEHTGKVFPKAIAFGAHPEHGFIWAEVPHSDKKGTIHHYFFAENNEGASHFTKSGEDPDYYKKLKTMEKAAPPPSGRHHVVLPVGSTLHTGKHARDTAGKVKVQHGNGESSWVSVRSGQVLSEDGHTISSRNPKGR